MMKFYKESACIVFYDTGILARFKVIIYVLTSNEFRQHEILSGEKAPNPFSKIEEEINMAVTKIWKVDYRLDHVVNYATDSAKTKNENTEKYRGCKSVMQEIMEYATNKDKTEKQFFVSGVNCNSETATKEMIDVKKKFNKYKRTPQNKSVAFHAVQSFVEGEVTPEIAHEIGVKLAEEMWGDRFQVVVTTHLNTDNIHNHFVVNSVSFIDGKKYYSNRENTGIFREISDGLCEEYGLSVLNPEECKKGKIDFKYYYNDYVSKDDYYQFIKEDIDYAISRSWSVNDFYNNIKKMGYEYKIRAEKISIRKYPAKKYVRLQRAFGDEYSIENIKNKIISRYPEIEEEYKEYKTLNMKLFYKGNLKNAQKPAGIYKLYKYYCFTLNTYSKKHQNYKLTFEMRNNLKQMHKYSDEADFLSENNIRTIQELNCVRNDLKGELKDLIRQRNNLYYKRQHELKIENKDDISKEIESISQKIVDVRYKIGLCNDIEIRSKKMSEEMKALQEKEQQEKVQKKNKVKKL